MKWRRVPPVQSCCITGTRRAAPESKSLFKSSTLGISLDITRFSRVGLMHSVPGSPLVSLSGDKVLSLPSLELCENCLLVVDSSSPLVPPAIMVLLNSSWLKVSQSLLNSSKFYCSLASCWALPPRPAEWEGEVFRFVSSGLKLTILMFYGETLPSPASGGALIIPSACSKDLILFLLDIDIIPNYCDSCLSPLDCEINPVAEGNSFEAPKFYRFG